MLFNLGSIKTGPIELPPRLLVLGVEKIGKSTFAAGAPKPVFIPIVREQGIDHLDVPRFPTANRLQDVMDALQALATEVHAYKNIVIDSISALESLIWADLCAESGVGSIEKIGGGFGKGYLEALGKWTELLSALDWLRGERGMGSILIGHVRIRLFSDPTADSYDRYELDLQDRASAAVMRWSDAIVFATSKVVVRKDAEGFNRTHKRGLGDDSRVLLTQKRPSHPGGGRGIYGHLPYELPLSWDAYAAAVEQAKRSQGGAQEK
jgi:hypothetical protein